MTDATFSSNSHEVAVRSPVAPRTASRGASIGSLIRIGMTLAFCGAMVVPDQEIAAKLFKLNLVIKNVHRRIAAG